MYVLLHPLVDAVKKVNLNVRKEFWFATWKETF